MEQDKELYLKFLEGDKNAFEQIMYKYMANVITFAKSYVKRLDIAEEIAQDVFVYLLINKKEYDFKYSLKTYLFTIAKSRALNYLKREKIYIYSQEDYENICDYSELTDVEHNIDLMLVIDKLPKKYQTAIFLADIEKMEYKEICRILNKTLPQVKMLIYRARNELKKIVAKEGLYNG